MKADAWIITYNGMSGAACIHKCLRHLLDRSGSFGAAINRMELYAFCRTADRILPGMKSMERDFHANFKNLPYVRFQRQARRFVVSFACRWVHTDKSLDAPRGRLPAADFRCLCEDFAAAMSLVRQRLKKSDDFDSDSFSEHLQARLEALPTPRTARRPAVAKPRRT